MFRISFFVDDKSLAPVLRNLGGHARDLQVIPVVNVVPEPNGEMRQLTDGSHTELLIAELDKRKMLEFSAKDRHVLLPAIGASSKSWNSLIHNSLKKGAIHRIGKVRARYGRGRGYIYGIRKLLPSPSKSKEK